MNNDLEKNITLRLATCSQCQTIGSECQACGGYHEVGVIGNKILLWDLPLSTLSNKTRQLTRKLDVLIDIILFSFGALAITILFFDMFSSGNYKLADVGRFTHLLFWISILSNMYLLYRFKSRDEKEEWVIKKSELKNIGQLPKELNTTELLSLPKEDTIRIHNVMRGEALDVIEDAYSMAKSSNHAQVLPVHVLAALLTKKEISEVFGRIAFDNERFIKMIKSVLAKQPKEKGKLVIAPQTIRLLLYSYYEAVENRRPKIDLAELLSAITNTDSAANEIMLDLDMSQNKIRHIVEWYNTRHDIMRRYREEKRLAMFKPKGVMDRAMTAVASPVLERMSTDLTYLSSRGVLEVCVNREKETDEILRVVESGNSVVLVGEDGVGKSAIINGLARLMTVEDVPKILQDKRLINLSVSSMLSGAGVGQLEGRIQKVMNEIARARNIVLVIENVHDLVGVATGGGQTFDISDILTEAIKKFNLLIIATTNSKDFSDVIENKSSLDSVMTKIDITEVDEDNAIRISEIKALGIEAKNNVYFSYGAIQSAVDMSSRYIHESHLPDKAINILEEAAVLAAGEKGEGSIVSADEVAKIIADKTNIPTENVTASESAKLLKLEDLIHNRIIGQDQAVTAVAEALRRARAELRDEKRPIATLLFLGPTGVGKTELSKTVAEAYFGSENDMIRVDMSEYQEVTSIARLIGDEESSGYLTEAVRKSPYSLLLLDELEKAHPDILNLFLQVMDDGRLTDGLGRTIDFTNVILIATSNANTSFIQDQLEAGKTVVEIHKILMEEELQKIYRPEFINRFDEIVVFKPLSEKDLVDITRLLLNKVEKRLLKKGINLRVTETAILELAHSGYDPKYGARPLRRVLQDQVDSALAKKILSGNLKRRDVAILEQGGKIRVESGEIL
ncbi:MAG: ATP-dependent Clp protease ATP-binding subunit [bacterium]